MKTLFKNTRVLIVGVVLATTCAVFTGCSHKMGCPGAITKTNVQTVNRPS